MRSEEIVGKRKVYYPPRMDSDGIFINLTLESEDESEGLFAVIRHRSAFWAILPEMDDPEPDLRFRLAVSRAGHPGSQHFSKPVCGVFPSNGLFPFP